MPRKQEVPKFGFENKIFKNVKVIEIVDGDTLKCVIDVGGGVFGNLVWVTVRLVEIDAPEMKGETAIEKLCAGLSMVVLAEKIFESGKLEILKKHISNIGKERINKILNLDYNCEKDENFKNEISDINKQLKEILNKEMNNIVYTLSSKSKLVLKTSGMDLYGRILGKLYIENDENENETLCINNYMCNEGVARYFKGTKAREKWCLEDLKKMAEQLLQNLTF